MRKQRKSKEAEQENAVIKQSVVLTFGLPNAVNRGVKKRVLVENESRECREYVDERTAQNH